EQEFPESRKIKIGQTVTVKVSMGLNQIEIQDMSNRTADAAEQQLKKDGFKVSTTFVENDDVTKNYVIRTEPAAHEMVPQGSTVVLIVSMGPKDALMFVPNLVNLPYTTAMERCEEYYLIPTIEWENSEEERGKVLRQSIDPQSQVNRNTEITLYVSTGEIPDKKQSYTISLPNNATGEFVFKYYFDSILNEEMTQTRDVSLSAAKSFKVEVTGKTGEKKQVAINVESVATGKSGTYMEFEVDFGEKDEDKPKYTILQQNSKIFKELATPDQVPVEETEEPVPETEEPDVPTVETEAPHSEPTSEPENTSEPTGGIPVD
ncbi:MAG: PASTA domain-containing protein, partial [Oscillospiraceae bacterium]|nr:PASTA domain-containing protein [Oscillospiraceae bacterium]